MPGHCATWPSKAGGASPSKSGTVTVCTSRRMSRARRGAHRAVRSTLVTRDLYLSCAARLERATTWPPEVRSAAVIWKTPRSLFTGHSGSSWERAGVSAERTATGVRRTHQGERQVKHLAGRHGARPGRHAWRQLAVHQVAAVQEAGHRGGGRRQVVKVERLLRRGRAVPGSGIQRHTGAGVRRGRGVNQTRATVRFPHAPGQPCPPPQQQ